MRKDLAVNGFVVLLTWLILMVYIWVLGDALQRYAGPLLTTFIPLAWILTALVLLALAVFAKEKL